MFGMFLPLRAAHYILSLNKALYNMWNNFWLQAWVYSLVFFSNIHSNGQRLFQSTTILLPFFIGTWIFCVHQQLQLQMWCIAVCVVRETVLWSCTSKLFIYELFCCHSSLLNGQVIFCLGKCVIWHTCPADNLDKKPIWILVSQWTSVSPYWRNIGWWFLQVYGPSHRQARSINWLNLLKKNETDIL